MRPGTDPTVPVVIVGAGPVGLSLALLLARRGIPAVVLERHDRPYGLPRAVHLDGTAWRVLEAIGVAEPLRGRVRPMPGVRLVDRARRPLVEFTRPDQPGLYAYPASSMFHQPDLDALLLEAVAAEPLISLFRGSEVVSVSPGPASTTVRYRDAGTGGLHCVHGEWVVGCDGADSGVRRSIGSGIRRLGFEERWLVVDGRCPQLLGTWSGVHQVCDPARPSTFMHVVDDRYRWEFRLAPGEPVGAVVDRLPDLLHPETQGAEVEIVRRATYTFRAAMADRWRHGRVLLAGDAAHQTPPFIGQGLSAGLLDAAALGWQLASVLAGGPGDLLDVYQGERAAHVRQLIRGAVLVGRLLPGQETLPAGALGAALRSAVRLPLVAPAASRLSSPRLGRGRLVRRRPFERLPGTFCPEPRPGADERLGGGWCLITRGPVDASVRVLDVSRLDDPGDRVLVDWLEDAGVHAALLRPDRIVAATARSEDEARHLRPFDLRSGDAAATW